MALAAGAAPALAKVEPNPEFLPYAHCPAKVKGVKRCLYATTTGGEFKLGNKTVPINKPIVLQGGLTETSEQLVEPVGAAAVSPVTLTVPGGLIGIEGLGGEVTATAELAGPASSILVSQVNYLNRTGIAVSLPLKVTLGNPLLGQECVIGSEASPILLHLTTGTTSPPPPNKPISGSSGKLTANKEGTIISFPGASLVDNSYSAPAASGCGGALGFLINPLVNGIVGLPAASGENTAVLNGTLTEAVTSAVRKAHVLPKTK